MSHGYVLAVIKRPHCVHGNEFEVLVALADYANEKGESCPSVKTLSIVCGICERTIQYCLNRLKKTGKIRADGTGDDGSVRYKLCTPPVQILHPPGATACTPPQILHPPPSSIPSSNGFSPTPPLPYLLPLLHPSIEDHPPKPPSRGVSVLVSPNPDSSKGIRLADDQFISQLKVIYRGINVDGEFAKMRGWMLSHPGKKLTRQFAVNWLNKVDRPINGAELQKASIRNSKWGGL